MTSSGLTTVNLYEPRPGSCEGFRIEKAASVAIETVSTKGFTPVNCRRKRSRQSLRKPNRATAFNDMAATHSI
jgi:hypothetical protein